MAISKEQAEMDLKKIMPRFTVVGKGPNNDLAAQMVIGTIGVLEGRIGDRYTVSWIYVNDRVKASLPLCVYDVARKYVYNEIKAEEARTDLREAMQHYTAIFQEMGVKPQTIISIFGAP